jgi:hypothetical protein
MKKMIFLLALLVGLPLMPSFTMKEQTDKVNGNFVIEKKEIATDFEKVKVTFYNASVSQCDETPLVTASGAVIDTAIATELHWCAISWNLHKRYGGSLNFGDVIRVEGSYGNQKISGNYVVQDLMNPMYKNKVDILRSTKDGGQSFDSAKIHSKKIKNHKQKLIDQKKIVKEKLLLESKYLKAQALKNAKRTKDKFLFQGIQKLLRKIPIISLNGKKYKMVHRFYYS